MKMVLPQISLTGALRHMRVTYTATLSVRAETAGVPVASAARRTAPAGRPQRRPCLELLQAGGAGDPLVARRHPGAAAGGRQRDRQDHRLRVPS